MSKKKSFLDFISENRFIHIIFSIILGLLVGALFLVVMGLRVDVVYGKLVESVSSVKGFSNVIVYAIPYIVAGLSVAFSFRTGVFNIGAEGQFVMGTMGAAVVGILLPDLPNVILVPLCFLTAMAAGALWGIIVGLLKTKRGINEVLSMIMFNWIAFYLSNFIAGLPMIKNEGSAEATKNISENAMIRFPKEMTQALGVDKTFNWGFILALVLAIIVYLIIEKTTLGYQLKAVGYNRFAAEYGGINVNRSILTALAISGALAGLAGALHLMGRSTRISIFSSQEGFGFAGIVVALIGCSNPFGVYIAGLFYGALMYGGTRLTLVGASSQLINVIVGTVVFFIAISVVFKNLKFLKRPSKAASTAKKGVNGQ